MNKADKAEILTNLIRYVSTKRLTLRQAKLLTKYYGVI